MEISIAKKTVFSGDQEGEYPSVSDAVLRSWRRLAEQGHNPNAQLCARRVKRQPRISANLLALFRRIGPSARETIGDPDHIGCFLVDPLGNLALTDSGTPFEEVLASKGWFDSMTFAEREVGTNAVDLAIRERAPCTTRGDEHTNSHFNDLLFYGVPLFGEDAELLGVLALAMPDAKFGGGQRRRLNLVGVLLEAVMRQTSSNADLQRRLDEQRAIADATRDGTMTINRDGVVEYMNKPAGHILGVDPDVAIGATLTETLGVKPVIAPIFESGEGYEDREVRLKTNKRNLHLVDTAIPIVNGAGEVVSVVNTFRSFDQVAKVARRFAGNRAQYTFESAIGSSPSINRAIDMSRRAANGSSNILLTGESGTGKELFAQGIHNASSRSDRPFVAVNCAALPKDLIETELFGYVPGSFTGANEEGRPGKFEIASGGTIFLDEISEMPIDVQAKLLRVLQERQVTRLGASEPTDLDIRIVAATNRKVEELIRDGGFREDLYYRINVIEIVVPALRDRDNDVDLLANHYAQHYAQMLGKEISGFSDQIRETFKAYHWPGNVRELQNVVERMVNFAEEPLIDEFADLPRLMRESSEQTVGVLAQTNGSFPTLQET
ncbi:MAG: sigma 54-interacting transcriptional regulator, partial [Hoeflea sp. D1-CHI-28]